MPAKKSVNKTKAKSAPKKTVRAKKPLKQTIIGLVVDRSSSMGPLRQAAFDGVNEQISLIKKNAKKTGKTLFSYIQFDHEIDVVIDKAPAAKLTPITPDQYIPRGTTALLDAIDATISNMQTGVAETEDTAYLMIIISDGEENSSRKQTYETIAEKITELTKTGKWTFTYMLSNIDLSVAKRMGFQTSNIASFTSTPTGVNQASTYLQDSLYTYSVARSSGVKSVDAFYDPNSTLATVDKKKKSSK